MKRSRILYGEFGLNHLLIATFIIAQTSCAVSKVNPEKITLNKGTKLVKLEKDPANPTTHKIVSLYKLPDKARANLTVKATGVEVNIHEPDKVGASSPNSFRIRNSLVKEFKADGTFRFGYDYQYGGNLKGRDLDNELYAKHKLVGTHTWGENLWYRDFSSFNTALVFPFKFRPAFFDSETNITKDYNISTSFNAGYIYGGSASFKSVRPVYNPISNTVVDVRTTRIGASLGLFFGLTTVRYNKDNVKSPDLLPEDRTVLGGTYGAALLLTYNKINIGLAIGKDRPFGKRRNDWIYYKEWWYGLTFGFDIIKL